MSVRKLTVGGATVQGVPLPKIKLLLSLPELAQRFSSFHHSLHEFHQPLHSLIRRLKESVQPPKDASHPLRGFIQRFLGLHQSLRKANQSLPDAKQPSFMPFLPKTTVFPHFPTLNNHLSTNH